MEATHHNGRRAMDLCSDEDAAAGRTSVGGLVAVPTRLFDAEEAPGSRAHSEPVAKPVPSKRASYSERLVIVGEHTRAERSSAAGEVLLPLQTDPQGDAQGTMYETYKRFEADMRDSTFPMHRQYRPRTHVPMQACS